MGDYFLKVLQYLSRCNGHSKSLTGTYIISDRHFQQDHDMSSLNLLQWP